MTTRRRNRKPPRVVLLDTRQLVQLDELVNRMRQGLEDLQQLTSLVVHLSESARVLLPMVSEMHQAQQKRSGAARRANQTRRQQQTDSNGAGAAELPAVEEHPNAE